MTTACTNVDWNTSRHAAEQRDPDGGPDALEHRRPQGPGVVGVDDLEALRHETGGEDADPKQEGVDDTEQ
jgi:hypothetical protein